MIKLDHKLKCIYLYMCVCASGCVCLFSKKKIEKKENSVNVRRILSAFDISVNMCKFMIFYPYTQKKVYVYMQTHLQTQNS